MSDAPDDQRKRDEEACVSLVRINGPAGTPMRAMVVFSCGHMFLREADWRCPCGMQRPPGPMRRDLPFCGRRCD